MKTNQVMIRDKDRFIQRTKDGYFSATALINHWNDISSKKKELPKYKQNSSTKEYIKQLNVEGIDSPMLTSNKGTWMHPKLFIDFAMWVSVEFKSFVIDCVLDGLIKSRHDAGDYYNQMTATIAKAHLYHYGTKPNPILYINEARTIKKILGIDKPRNEMTEKELSDITSMQKLNSLLISDNVGKNSRIKQLEQHKRLLNI